MTPNRKKAAGPTPAAREPPPLPRCAPRAEAAKPHVAPVLGDRMLLGAVPRAGGRRDDRPGMSPATRHDIDGQPGRDGHGRDQTDAPHQRSDDLRRYDL